MMLRLRRLLTASGVDMASELQTTLPIARHVAAISYHGQISGRLGAGRPDTALRHDAKGNVRLPAQLQFTLAVAVTGAAFKLIVLIVASTVAIHGSRQVCPLRKPRACIVGVHTCSPLTSHSC